MYKWIALGLGAYLLFGKKKEDIIDPTIPIGSDTPPEEEVKNKIIFYKGIKLESQPMPPGADVHLQKIPAGNPVKIHDVVKYANVIVWNYHTATGGKANIKYVLGSEGETLLDKVWVYPGWVTLDPSSPSGIVVVGYKE
jgi:hypothetical protein